MSAADGSVAAHYEYDPFGKLNYSSGSYADSNPFKFSTKYHDAETGLAYYGYRYYSPELGRWLNRDPIGEKGGTNLYAFVINDPIDDIDPKGLRNILGIPFGMGIPGLDAEGRGFENSVRDLPKYTYCRYGSAAVSSCLDLTGLYLSATGAGLPAGSTIFLISTANNAISAKVCGAYRVAAFSELLDIASLTITAGGLKTQVGIAVADIIINLNPAILEY